MNGTPEAPSDSNNDSTALDEMGARLEKQLEFDPVSPVDSHWLVAGKAVAMAAFVLSVGIIMIRGLRFDKDALGPWLMWGLFALELMLVVVFSAIVYSEAVPSRRIKPTLWLAFLPAILAVQLSVAAVTYWGSPVDVAPERATLTGLRCMGTMALMGLVPLGLGFWFLSRGLPLRPRISGMLVGLVGGLLADSVYRLHCPYSGLDHMLRWHSAAVLVLGALGFCAGVFWDRMLVLRWRTRRATHASKKGTDLL